MIIAKVQNKLVWMLAVVGCLLCFSMLSGTTYAQTDVIGPGCEGVSGSTLCDNNKSQPPGANDLYGPDGVLTKIADIIATVVGVAAVIVIIIGGIRYGLSSGDSQNVNGAKNAIMFAVIGLLVALLAKAIVLFVLSRI